MCCHLPLKRCAWLIDCCPTNLSCHLPFKQSMNSMHTVCYPFAKGFCNSADAAVLQGAIVTFTKGLSSHLISRGIRVNCIAPGPVWTPLVVASFPDEMVSTPPQLMSCLCCGHSSVVSVLKMCISNAHVSQLNVRLCCLLSHGKVLWLQTKTFGTDMTPIARPAQPKEYGPPAVFLATETDSSYVVGAILSVTGGMLIN